MKNSIAVHFFSFWAEFQLSSLKNNFSKVRPIFGNFVKKYCKFDLDFQPMSFFSNFQNVSKTSSNVYQRNIFKFFHWNSDYTHIFYNLHHFSNFSSYYVEFFPSHLSLFSCNNATKRYSSLNHTKCSLYSRIYYESSSLSHSRVYGNALSIFLDVTVYSVPTSTCSFIPDYRKP